MILPNAFSFWFLLNQVEAKITPSSGQHTATVHHHDKMSRHLLIEDLSMVAVLAEAITTEGPFDEEESDYANNSNLLAAAIDLDRESVLEGVPLTLNLNLYNISDGSVGRELSDVEVFLWHCDALGIYSAVDSRMQSENTEGQKWLRGKQVSDDNGSVVFETILPGWYSGRALHYHFRMRLPGADSLTYVATSQLFVSDDDLKLYENLYPYSGASMSQTPLATDHIYNGISEEAAKLLTLDLDGSVDTGFQATVNLGLTGMEKSSTSFGGGGEMMPPGDRPEGDGGPPMDPATDMQMTSSDPATDLRMTTESETSAAAIDSTSGAGSIGSFISLGICAMVGFIAIVF